MSRLISLEVWDFQPHRHRLIEFDSLVTCLVGPNSAGKSSLIRAIRWVAFNRPLGDSVIRWGATSAKVRLVTEVGKFIREKGDGANTYKLGTKPYKAFGTGVPETISKNLQLYDVNFQRQIEAPFWLAQGPAEVAREMNKVVDLDVIDRSMAYAVASIKNTRNRVKIFTELAEDSDKRRLSLSWVVQAERLLQEHDCLALARDTALRRLQEVSGVVRQIREAERSTRKLPDMTKIDKSINELRVVRSRLGELSWLVEGLRCERKQLRDIQTSIAAKEVEVSRLKPSLCETCGQMIPTGPS